MHVFTIEELFGYKNKFKIMLFKQPKEEFQTKQGDKDNEKIKEMFNKNENSIKDLKKDFLVLQSVIKTDSEKHQE